MTDFLLSYGGKYTECKAWLEHRSKTLKHKASYFVLFVHTRLVMLYSVPYKTEHVPVFIICEFNHFRYELYNSTSYFHVQWFPALLERMLVPPCILWWHTALIQPVSTLHLTPNHIWGQEPGIITDPWHLQHCNGFYLTLWPTTTVTYQLLVIERDNLQESTKVDIPEIQMFQRTFIVKCAN